MRSEYDDFFSSQPADQQDEMMLAKINRWRDGANNQAAHYYRTKQAAESVVKLESLLQALPRTGPIKGFLHIVQISKSLINETELKYKDRNYNLNERGWSNGGLNIYGFKSCTSKLGPRHVYTISAEQCLAQEDQAELYLTLLAISKMPFSFPPKDEEFYSPWGTSFRDYGPSIFQ